ncbi:unnamed protein product [Amoebophrya sp. A120]|nr:unnamed protein product [Amoebophrya sp. A120]|eukprot:GSA120T00005463001.1
MNACLLGCGVVVAFRAVVGFVECVMVEWFAEDVRQHAPTVAESLAEALPCDCFQFAENQNNVNAGRPDAPDLRRRQPENDSARD